tara:strand:+ start:334 stop:567 length:234 start_codon:yes stop_codon:yes gene_type:complete
VGVPATPKSVVVGLSLYLFLNSFSAMIIISISYQNVPKAKRWEEKKDAAAIPNTRYLPVIRKTRESGEFRKRIEYRK